MGKLKPKTRAYKPDELFGKTILISITGIGSLRRGELLDISSQEEPQIIANVAAFRVEGDFRTDPNGIFKVTLFLRDEENKIETEPGPITLTGQVVEASVA